MGHRQRRVERAKISLDDTTKLFLDVSVHPKCPPALADPNKLRKYPIKDFLDLLEYIGYSNDLELAMHEDALEDANIQ